MSTPSNTASASVSTGGLSAVLLTIALGAAKIFGYLDISWWLVFLPMYAGLLLLLFIGGLVLLVLGLMKFSEKLQRRRLRKRRERRLKETGSTASRRHSLR